MVSVGNWPRIITIAGVTYGIAVYGSYKYSNFTNKQEQLRDVKD